MARLTGIEVGFGIDLAGYTTGSTACAEATADGAAANVRIIRKNPLSKSRDTSANLEKVADEELRFIKAMLATRDSAIAVDMPIDLQGLPAPSYATQIWQLTLRPIDKALGGLAPLANFIGAPTARLKYLLEAGGLKSSLGTRIFETYPAGSLKMLGRRRDDFASRSDQERFDLSQDEVDAAICALTILASKEHRLEGPELASYVSEQGVTPTSVPDGYVLLKSLPFRSIAVTCVDSAAWFEERRSQ